MEYAQSVVSGLSVLTVLGQVIVLVLVTAFLAPAAGWSRGLLRWVSKNALWLMFIVALVATVGSLFFSEIAGWNPCRWCWYQRIFMYPQVVLLGLAILRKDRSIAPYIVALSVIGLLFALWHYGEQAHAALFPQQRDPNVPCDASGVSCRSTPFFHFGYITIPMMAFTAFLLNITGAAVMMRRK